MSETSNRWLRFARPALRLRRDTSAASAVEFAIVAGPFFLLMMALIEVTLVFFANFTLENAVEQSARLIRTGQAQSFSESQFKEDVCARMTVLPDCAGKLKLDVRKFENFNSVDLTQPFDKDGKLKEDFNFDTGGGGEVIVVRAFYEWSLVAKIPGFGLANMADGNRLLIATSTFRNEPF